ncbi:MAG: hypothetical protein VW455_12845 [Nitrospinota bacterium]
MVALFLFSCLPNIYAGEPEEAEKTPAEQEQETPSLDFLEFLCEWETEEGDWIAPEDLENMPLDENGNNDTKNE